MLRTDNAKADPSVVFGSIHGLRSWDSHDQTVLAAVP